MSALAYEAFRAIRSLFTFSSNFRPYVYSELPTKRHIRLLRLIRDDRGAFKGWGLSTFEIGRCPTYVAASYTWGEAVDSSIDRSAWVYRWKTQEQIVCDGMSLTITGNLGDFLRLWKSEEELEWIWIDAICINQTDLSERASQVQLMGDVYSEARCVTVWLGASTSRLQSVRWLLEEFVDAVETHITEHGFDKLSQTNIRDPAFTRMLGLSESSYDITSKFQDYRIFNDSRRWFERAWIVQEVALARDIVVICGKDVLSWERMAALSKLIHACHWSDQLLMNPGTGGKQLVLGHQMRIIDAMRSLCKEIPSESKDEWQQFFKNWAEDCSDKTTWYNRLLYLLTGIRSHLATQDEDKIFAILGMANKFLPQEMKAPIEPSYKKTAKESYLDVATLLVQHASKLLLLSAVENRSSRRLMELPSWVPDFSVRETAAQLVHLSGGKTYDCSKNLQRKPEIVVIGDVLKLFGAEFDEVAEVCMSTQDLETMPDLFSLINFISRFDKLYEPTGQVRLEAICRTMIADVKADGMGNVVHPAPSYTLTGFHDWLRFKMAIPIYKSEQSRWNTTEYIALLDGLEEEFHSEPGSKIFPSKAEILEFASWMDELKKNLAAGKAKEGSLEDLIKQTDGQIAEFGVTMLASSADRRLYRTRKGYMGLGPLSMCEGDSIAFLSGAVIPFVFRRKPSGTEYELIGELYLHGFMHGEMLTAEFTENISTLSIV